MFKIFVDYTLENYGSGYRLCNEFIEDTKDDNILKSGSCNIEFKTIKMFAY